MLNIIFSSAENLEDVRLATEKYQNIWKNEGELITNYIEVVTGLEFKEKDIQALVHKGISKSDPLQLSSRYKSFGKRATLIHELMHKLLYTCGVDKNEVLENKLESHKVLYLVLYDVWNEVYGKEFANWAVNVEKSWGEIYLKAWKWALSFNKNERKRKFREIVARNINH